MTINKRRYHDYYDGLGGWHRVPNEIWECDLDHTCKVVWCYLLSRDSTWDSSRNNIARNLGMSVNTVSGCVRSLCNRNMLVKSSRGGQNWDFEILPPTEWKGVGDLDLSRIKNDPDLVLDGLAQKQCSARPKLDPHPRINNQERMDEKKEEAPVQKSVATPPPSVQLPVAKLWPRWRTQVSDHLQSVFEGSPIWKTLESALSCPDMWPVFDRILRETTDIAGIPIKEVQVSQSQVKDIYHAAIVFKRCSGVPMSTPSADYSNLQIEFSESLASMRSDDAAVEAFSEIRSILNDPFDLLLDRALKKRVEAAYLQRAMKPKSWFKTEGGRKWTEDSYRQALIKYFDLQLADIEPVEWVKAKLKLRDEEPLGAVRVKFLGKCFFPDLRIDVYAN